MSAKPSVREKFSLEFVTGADLEVSALKSLFATVEELPELDLFDPEAILAPAAQLEDVEEMQVSSLDSNTSYSVFEEADPVAELRMLFGSVNS